MFENIFYSSNIRSIKELCSELSRYKDVVDFYNPDYIERYTSLAFYLYVYKNDNLKFLLDYFDTLKFIDYNTWIWIRPLLMLKSRVSEEPREDYKKQVWSTLESKQGEPAWRGEVRKKAFARTLRGEGLGEDEVIQARSDNDFFSERELVLTVIMELVVISEMGASKEFTVQDAEDKIEIYTKRLIELEKL